MFIYNQMGGIDEAALDRLSLVTQMTKHIRVRVSGGRSTTSELGQFSPVFAWLLRDFYLDLVEENRRITPRDYLELALRPVQGGKDVSAKNEIRESIRALFPDRECFALVRPLNNESDLQRLDQIPLNRLRPEFRSGLDALAKFVFERTRPKQVGATVMTGPILAGITQTFVEAINKGAVPTISSSWQSVEEAECRRAYDHATEVYLSSFDRTKPADDAILRGEHEVAVQKALSAFTSGAVGAGSVRLNYEKLLHNFLRKTFEEYTKNAFLEADMHCSRILHTMESKLRAACQVPDAKVENILRVLDGLVADYKSSCFGPGKCEKLVSFVQHCVEGPIKDLFKKHLDKIESERTALKLRCASNDDKLDLLKKQVESNEKHRAEYLKRYEDAISDKKRIAEDYSIHVTNLKSKCSTLEERCLSLSKSLELIKGESGGWKMKYDRILLEQKAEEEKLRAEIAALETRSTAAEGRLVAVREQANSAEEEATEWRRKYEFVLAEAKEARDRAAQALEHSNKRAREREDALRAEFSKRQVEKDVEIRKLNANIEQAELQASSLISRLEAAESRAKSHEFENIALNEKTNRLTKILDSTETRAQSHEKECKLLEQQKNHFQEKYLSECKNVDAAERRSKDAENEAKKAIELADIARAEAAAAHEEKNEARRLAVERLTLIERAQRQVENLEREKSKLIEEVTRLRSCELEATSKADLLEGRLEEREREIEELLSRSNEQRSSTVHVLESLLATERAALAEANNRAEALSIQLQATQSKLDALQQEHASVRLMETAIDSQLRTAQGKRLRMDYFPATESVQDMDIDGETLRDKKRSKSTLSPSNLERAEDGGSVYGGADDDDNRSQRNQETGSEDYTKLTVVKLKQELTKHGYGEQLLQLKNPIKKDILALYAKHVLKK